MVFNSVVKESCFKHLQDITTKNNFDVTKILSHNQPRSQCMFLLSIEVQKNLRTRLSNNGKGKFYRFLLYKVEVERVKMSTFLSARPLARLFFTNCKWRKPKNFVIAVLVIVLWINLSLLYCGIFACSPA